MLGQRRRRWYSIKIAVAEYITLLGDATTGVLWLTHVTGRCLQPLKNESYIFFDFHEIS